MKVSAQLAQALIYREEPDALTAWMALAQELDGSLREHRFYHQAAASPQP
jgi:hypothetical protein